ncbi:MAG: hypothetical protein IPH82_17785 [Chloroflexi bacterium]|nr:hypothetical protein [Chloroflexota bacterium]
MPRYKLPFLLLILLLVSCGLTNPQPTAVPTHQQITVNEEPATAVPSTAVPPTAVPPYGSAAYGCAAIAHFPVPRFRRSAHGR